MQKPAYISALPTAPSLLRSDPAAKVRGSDDGSALLLGLLYVYIHMYRGCDDMITFALLLGLPRTSLSLLKMAAAAAATSTRRRIGANSKRERISCGRRRIRRDKSTSGTDGVLPVWQGMLLEGTASQLLL